MTQRTQIDGDAFARQVILVSWIFSLPALAVVLTCLSTMLELTSEQWRWFLGMAASYMVLITWPQHTMQRSMTAAIRTYLDARCEDVSTPEQAREAFRVLMDLPRRSAWFGAAGWVFPVVVIAPAMALVFPTWRGFEIGVVILSGLAAGFVSASFLLFYIKRVSRPVCDLLTAELVDPVERRGLIRPLSIRSKLAVCATGVTMVPVIFAVLLSDAKVDRARESMAIAWQVRVLDAVADHLEGGATLSQAENLAVGNGTVLPASIDISRLDLDRPGSLLEPSVIEHLREQLGEGAESGDSTLLPSAWVFSWRLLDDGRLLTATTGAAEIEAGGAGMWLVFGALLLFSTLVALGLAVLLSSDVSSATEALRGEAGRMASGDLRRGRIFESEDELGELARAFESMSASLRDTVGRVTSAADRVEATAGEMSTVSESVATVTADQVRGLQETTRSMEAIDEQVRGIAESSQALNVSVEESSSSILELGAAGEELNDTASVLSGKVEEVSSSIEQMVRSVKQVSENTEALSEASVETSASMEEMASSLREVDTSAEEAARLSREVVDSSEGGQMKVRQTIEGMEAIRDATETAETVIRSLGSRSTEIGAIVDVIDDVADETNLLALNAAIIAAQAGEHGRAFSVVADEIKDLADRVLTSTKEIGTLIRSVQDEASNAIGAIELGSASVASGVDLSAEAGVSLEQITAASRESGTRISGIVASVREQARAAAHVVELMERVRGGVDEIRSAAGEQDRGNEVVYRSTVAMQEVAQQVRGTTEEQARGSGRIRESVEGVREAVEQINGALQEQSAACRSALEFLEGVASRTRINEESVQRMDDATRSLQRHAEGLRTDVGRFQI
jgi:methyl-accepting chemotaxis protein